MTTKEITNKGYILTQSIAGSRMFGFHTDESDTDLRGVYALPLNLIGERYSPKVVVEPNSVMWEISEFARLLKEGDPDAIWHLFSPDACRRISKTHFRPFIRIREEIMSRATMERWLNLASVYYSKALRFGDIQMEKTSLDFMTFVSNDKEVIAHDFKEVIRRGHFHETSSRSYLPIDLNSVGLLPIDRSKGLYYLYRDHMLVPIGVVKGILDKEGEIIENGVDPSNPHFHALVSEGLLIYDKEKYRNYQKARRNLKNAKVINGYATKSMMYAMVMLELISSFLTEGTLTMKVDDPKSYKLIREGVPTREEIKTMFQTLFTYVRGRVDAYNGHLLPNEVLIQKALEEVRSNTEHSVRYSFNPKECRE